MRAFFYWLTGLGLFAVLLIQFIWPPVLYFLFFLIPYAAIGLYDIFFTTHNVLCLYPVIGHLRYMFEFIRPEIQQYFIATNQSGRPYSREIRSLIYQRCKEQVDTLPFGTQQEISGVGYELAYHSLAPRHVSDDARRFIIGGPDCLKPYDAARLNISAMSFGALSSTAVEAMNLGAKLGNFAQDTGEGGISAYHLKHGGSLIWEIGTGYFGCRTPKGGFDTAQFTEKAQLDVVKMIEIKLSQGAKPSHGGILPAAKINEEIAQYRGVSISQDCISPPAHTTFETPEGLLKFVQQLRALSGGKPTGFKLCLGVRQEFMGICKAMLSTGITPDFITVDGAEGGTGAAPLEYSNRLGTPINEALVFVHSCLLGIDVRDKIKVIASGKIATGFDMVTKLALGADACNVARPMMFAVGCIQALRCNTNTCPTGVTTQDPKRTLAINPEEKAQHVYHYQQATLKSFLEITGALGVNHPDELKPHHIQRRVSDETSKSYAEIYPYLNPGELLTKNIHPAYAQDWASANATRFS